MRTLPMGSCAVLVEHPPIGPTAWANGLRALAVPGVIDVVPAAETVLVRCADPVALARTQGCLEDVVPIDTAAGSQPIEIEVTYDGDDLAHVASATGLDVDEVIELHTGANHHVAFCGFAPGFGYLTGLPEQLRLPRRSSPRVRVPAGSVAIAAEYSAVYPRATPGGWHLLGRTAEVMFDPARTPPALLQPGARVRFVARP